MMVGIVQDTSFAHLYDYTLLSERPGGAALTYFYPGARTDGGCDGVLVRLRAPGTPSWVGVFASGTVPGGMSGVYTHPDEWCLCVVSRGDGYIVRVDEPTQWAAIQAHPIFDAVAVPDCRLLAFATYSELIAYGAAGPIWQTGRLALDEVHITRVEGARIYARANRIDGLDVTVTVDGKTGVADTLHPW